MDESILHLLLLLLLQKTISRSREREQEKRTYIVPERGVRALLQLGAESVRRAREVKHSVRLFLSAAAPMPADQTHPHTLRLGTLCASERRIRIQQQRGRRRRNGRGRSCRGRGSNNHLPWLLLRLRLRALLQSSLDAIQRRTNGAANVRPSRSHRVSVQRGDWSCRQQ